LSPSGGAQRRPEGPDAPRPWLDSRVALLRAPENDKRAVSDKVASAVGRRDGGFALVETLVALVILTLGLAALIEILGGGFRGIRDSEVDSAALHLARQQLALAAARTPLRETERAGATAEGLQWRVAVEPYEPPRLGLSAAAAAGPQAYWVTSEVRWKPSALARQRSVALTTLRLAAP
jgi:general secretion pathway protein I